MFHADGRTDGQINMTKLTVAFRNSEKASKSKNHLQQHIMSQPHNQPYYYLLIILVYISAMLQTCILSADIAAILRTRFKDRHFELSSKKLYGLYAFIYTVDKQEFQYSERSIGRNTYLVENLCILNCIMDQYY